MLFKYQPQLMLDFLNSMAESFLTCYCDALFCELLIVQFLGILEKITSDFNLHPVINPVIYRMHWNKSLKNKMFACRYV